MAVNDEVMNNLAQYEGGSVNERIYNFLGNLGYTGTLSDRLANYSSEGRKGWQGLLEDLGIWTPAQVFSQGEQGLFFVPKPVLFGSQFLYQDSEGTTLTDAHGDPVGLMLDLHKGLVKGPSTVDLYGDWVDIAASGSVVDNGDGTVTFNGDPSAASVFRNVSGTSSTAGSIYEAFVVVESINGSIEFGPDGDDDFFLSAGTISRLIAAERGGTDRPILRMSAPGQSVTISSASFRELPGNHLTQSVSADRPTYNTDGSLHWLESDGVSDNLNVSYGFGDISQGFTLSIASELIDQAADDDFIFSLGSSTSDTPLFCIRYNSTSGISAIVRNVDTGTWQPSGIPLDALPHVITLSISADGVQLFIDGNSIAQQAFTGDLSVDRLCIGALERAGLSNHCNAKSFAAVAVKAALTESDRQNMESYLADRAGITL